MAQGPLILLPCPFCAGPAVMEEVPARSVGDSRWSVGCQDKDGGPECMGYQSLTTFSRKIEAANAWNTRNGKLVTLIEGEKSK
jgi:hypothetical protein